jgi:hypothetical protein
MEAITFITNCHHHHHQQHPPEPPHVRGDECVNDRPYGKGGVRLLRRYNGLSKKLLVESIALWPMHFDAVVWCGAAKI